MVFIITSSFDSLILLLQSLSAVVAESGATTSLLGHRGIADAGGVRLGGKLWCGVVWCGVVAVVWLV